MCQIIGGGDKSLESVAQKVFLASPQGQVFLFFSRQDLNELFSISNKKEEASESIIQRNKLMLSSLFLYDFSIISVLVEAFNKALRSDQEQAIKTRGRYGDEYAKLSSDMEGVFNGKIVEQSVDLTEIVVKTMIDGKEVVMRPEDLSHGELRRLVFYTWLRTKEIKDSIVLVDEIEIGLHPDWQYQIVKDLEDWAPSNQYILATHSYDVCSALTPAHVKEIAPKLTKKSAPSAN
jgi:hypothetical protein